MNLSFSLQVARIDGTVEICPCLKVTQRSFGSQNSYTDITFYRLSMPIECAESFSRSRSNGSLFSPKTVTDSVQLWSRYLLIAVSLRAGVIGFTFRFLMLSLKTMHSHLNKPAGVWTADVSHAYKSSVTARRAKAGAQGIQVQTGYLSASARIWVKPFQIMNVKSINLALQLEDHALE